MEQIEKKLFELAKEFETYCKNVGINNYIDIYIDGNKTGVTVICVNGGEYTINFGDYSLQIRCAMYSNRITKPFDITDQEMEQLYNESKSVLDRLLTDEAATLSVKEEEKMNRIKLLEYELEQLKNE
jgi:hypothetical protein